VPELVKKYGGKISFMTGIDDNIIDRPDWSAEQIAEITEKACRACGKLYFIPCVTHGLNFCIFPGEYECVSENINRMSEEMF
jgi:hypothetical protein